LRRGEIPPRQANIGLVGDPGLRRAALVIAGIAVIADIARDRKTRASPLMNTGDTDQESDDRLKAPEWSAARMPERSLTIK
jgi:hypothetical protein